MIRVMLVDDEESALDILEILLGKIGNIVIVGRYINPLQALEAFETMRPDAVFLDIQMPGIRGMEAARRMQKSQPQTQIVFTTAFSEYALEAFEIASVDYLLKPFTLDRLRQTVSRFSRSVPESGRDADGEIERTAFVQLLGGFCLYTKTGLLSWKTNKEKELCAFLIHHRGHSVEADTIIDALWPESELKKARSYFYTCMSYLRKNFQMNGVQLRVNKTGEGYYIDSRELENDVEEFAAFLKDAASERCLTETQYDRLNKLYKGEYLEGCDYRWAMWKREELQAEYVRTLRILQKKFASQGSLPLAIDSLKRILTLEPDSEKDGRELIKLYLAANNRSEALKVFKRLDQAVRINLGLGLEEATVRLYEAIAHNSGGEVVWEKSGQRPSQRFLS